MKSRTMKFRMIVSLIIVLVIFAVIFISLPYLNMNNRPSTTSAKIVNAQTVDKYFGGKWEENDSLSGYVEVEKSEYVVHFYNGTTRNVSSGNLSIINPQISKYLGIIEVDLNRINFTTFYNENGTLSAVILNYSSLTEPKEIYDTIYSTFKGESKVIDLSFHNISENAFIASICCYQFSIGYAGNEIAIMFYKGNINETQAITDIMNYVL